MSHAPIEIAHAEEVVTPLYTRSFALAFVSQAGFVMANLLMAHYGRWIAFLGGSVSDIGWVMGLGSLGALLLRPWMGQWLNRIGARNMWLLGYVFFLCGTLGNLAIYQLGLPIYVLRVCTVLGVACVSSSSLTFVSQVAPAHRQAEAIGVFGVSGFLAFIIGPYLGDIILGTVGRSRTDFLVLFVTTAGILVIPTIILAFLRDPVGRQKAAALSLSDFAKTVYRYWPGTNLMVMAMFGVCLTVPLAFLARFIDETNLSITGVSEIGLFFICYSVIGLTIRIGMRRVPDIIGAHRVLLIGLFIMAAGMFAFLLVDNEQPWWLIAPGLLCGAGHGLMFHTGSVLILESFPHEVRGTGSALSFIMLDAGFMLGAPILGIIAELSSYTWMFVTIGVSCVVTGLLYGWTISRKTTRNRIPS